MRIFIATDITVFKHNGQIFANQKHSTIFKRYSKVFGKIILCSRIEKIDRITESFEDITDIIESTISIVSLANMLFNGLNKEMAAAIKKCDLVICRCPAISAYKAADIAHNNGIPYLAESMGDAWDAYWNHGVQGKAIAPYMFLKMKSVVRNADYAVYVTSKYLQKRYPCKSASIAASNVLIQDLENEVLEKRKQKIYRFEKKTITLMTTAAVDVWYKGQQYVIKAIKQLNSKGISIRYLVVGEGDTDYLKRIAEKEGVSSQVIFCGRLPLNEVFILLDETDIYIQPSLQEGLPRSVIEAMSRGCVCIGAHTAGIPELIDDSMVVKRKSVEDIVKKILYYIGLPVKEKIEMSEKNFNQAKQYTAEVLDSRRNKYFLRIKNRIASNTMH